MLHTWYETSLIEIMVYVCYMYSDAYHIRDIVLSYNGEVDVRLTCNIRNICVIYMRVRR